MDNGQPRQSHILLLLAIIATPPARATFMEAMGQVRLAMVTKTALIICGGAFFSGADFAWRTVGFTAILASGLWACLYLLNEAWDLSCEQGRARYYFGEIVTLAAVIGLIVVSRSIAPFLPLLFALMVMSQLIYALPGLRLKQYWWGVLLLSGLINPLLRLHCGAVFGTHPIPAIAYLAVLALHLTGTIRTRTLRQERDAGLGYRVLPHALRYVGMGAGVVGFIALGIMCIIGVMPRSVGISVVAAAIYTAYIWSGRIRDIRDLRKGWLLCAPLAIGLPLLWWR